MFYVPFLLLAIFTIAAIKICCLFFLLLTLHPSLNFMHISLALTTNNFYALFVRTFASGSLGSFLVNTFYYTRPFYVRKVFSSLSVLSLKRNSLFFHGKVNKVIEEELCTCIVTDFLRGIQIHVKKDL